MKVILVHGGMMYRCKDCRKHWYMNLEIGVEDNGRNGRPHQPCPFVIRCHECGGMAMDVSGYLPLPYVRPLRPGMRYFSYDDSGRNYACGQPKLYMPEALKKDAHGDVWPGWDVAAQAGEGGQDD